MDELAQFGALVVTGYGSEATTVTTDQLPQDDSRPPPEFTAIDRDASDAVFTAPPAKHPPSLAMTALVVTSAALTLKNIVIDQARSVEDLDETPPREKSEDER